MIVKAVYWYGTKTSCWALYCVILSWDDLHTFRPSVILFWVCVCLSSFLVFSFLGRWRCSVMLGAIPFFLENLWKHVLYTCFCDSLCWIFWASARVSWLFIWTLLLAQHPSSGASCILIASFSELVIISSVKIKRSAFHILLQYIGLY